MLRQLFSIFVIMFCCCCVAQTSLRDPTAPTTSEFSDGAQGFKVSGILYGSNRYMAIINNQMALLGDEVMGAKVVAIDPYQVKLRGDEQEFFVPLCYDIKDKPKGSKDER